MTPLADLLLSAGIRTQSELNRMSDEDMRNTLIVEYSKKTGMSIPQVQAFSTDDLITRYKPLVSSSQGQAKKYGDFTEQEVNALIDEARNSRNYDWNGDDNFRRLLSEGYDFSDAIRVNSNNTIDAAAVAFRAKDRIRPDVYATKLPQVEPDTEDDARRKREREARQADTNAAIAAENEARSGGSSGKSEAQLGAITDRATIGGKPAAKDSAGQWHVLDGGSYQPATSDQQASMTRAPEPSQGSGTGSVSLPEQVIAQPTPTPSVPVPAPMPTPTPVATPAPSTTMSVASDGQSLGTQSPETQAAFRAAYGTNAEAEWVKQHDAALKAPLVGTGSFINTLVPTAPAKPSLVPSTPAPAQPTSALQQASQALSQATSSLQTRPALSSELPSLNVRPATPALFPTQSSTPSFMQRSQQPSFLDMLLGAVMARMFGIPLGGQLTQGYQQPLLSTGEPDRLRTNQPLDPPTVRDAQPQPAAQPAGPMSRQPVRILPEWLFPIPSTQMFSNFSPSERTGTTLLAQGMGIRPEDFADQILRLAPPGGQSAQQFLQPMQPRY